MAVNELTGMAVVEEDEASPEVARIYAEIRQNSQLPFVPNIFKSLAASPPALQIYFATYRTFYEQITLPEALVSIMFYAIAHSNECQYCSAGHEASCRMMGIDEDILQLVANDLGKVSPERVRAIVEFALLAAHDPKVVSLEDFDRLRDYGITDSEIGQIVLIAALGHLGDTLADTLKVQVEESTREMLGR